ncbi:MAG: hypothetical protein C0622_05220 [Desulfuromonas sp.]|nr:MAG: hypothetical protein C0622_05220 [Desulfuromonas sp.]
MATRKANRSNDIYGRQIKIIKMAQSQLGISDADYREILTQNFGKSSSTALSVSERDELIKILKEKGFELKAVNGRNKYPGRPRNMDGNTPRARHLRKIEALLTVGKKPWSYVHSMAKDMYGVDDITFMDDLSELRGIITALRRQGQREGWDLSGEK